MKKAIETEIMINAPIQRVFEYYTDADNIQKAWPHDIVKESENISSQNGQEEPAMKVEAEYLGKKDEMILEVVQKEQNKRFVTRQTQGPFESWESIQEFQSNGNVATLVNHTINYELPTTGKIANFLSGSQLEDKLREGLQQSTQTTKQILENA